MWSAHAETSPRDDPIPLFPVGSSVSVQGRGLGHRSPNASGTLIHSPPAMPFFTEGGATAVRHGTRIFGHPLLSETSVAPRDVGRCRFRVRPAASRDAASRSDVSYRIAEAAVGQPA